MTRHPGVAGYLLVSASPIRVGRAATRWVPGLREGAPKRNVVLLVVYLEALLFGLGIVRHLL